MQENEGNFLKPRKSQTIYNRLDNKLKVVQKNLAILKAPDGIDEETFKYIREAMVKKVAILRNLMRVCDYGYTNHILESAVELCKGDVKLRKKLESLLASPEHIASEQGTLNSGRGDLPHGGPHT